MADITEVMSDTLTKDDILRRVDDWACRIDDLYDRVTAWLPAGWRGKRSRTRDMAEELMREFGVPPRLLPILDLAGPNGRGAFIEPRGLWILGPNGRLDLIGSGIHCVIVDRAERFETPDWRIAPLSDRTQTSPFDKASLARALSP